MATTSAILQPGNVAVVTGAALGIGRAMCKRFAEAGMSVVLADLPGKDLDASVRELGALSPRGSGSVLGVPTDVADPDQVERLRDTVVAKFGKANVLANNAATRVGRGFAPISATGEKQWTSTCGAPSSGCVLSCPVCWRRGARCHHQCRLKAGDYQSTGPSDLQHDEGRVENLHGTAGA